mgnify:CR=1 FL=1
MKYYVFETEVDARACIDYINGTDWFPIIGQKNGVDAPESQATTSWTDLPSEMLSTEWAVPRIPESRLDYLGVTQEERDSFLAVFGTDIRTLTSEDFPVSPEEL